MSIIVFYGVLSGGGTQRVVLRATATQNRVINAHGGPKRRLKQAPTAVAGTPST